MIQFVEFPKIPRLSRNCIITEKIDGTNASIYIPQPDEDIGDVPFLIGSRQRWITPCKSTDNYGFAGWAMSNVDALLLLGPCHHFGEWWGLGIQRNYGVTEKRFSLFNVRRWNTDSLMGTGCYAVPTLFEGEFSTTSIDTVLDCLVSGGSVAAPWFMNPEGVVVYHTAARELFKKTIEKDAEPKSRAA